MKQDKVEPVMKEQTKSAEEIYAIHLKNDVGYYAKVEEIVKDLKTQPSPMDTCVLNAMEEYASQFKPPIIEEIQSQSISQEGKEPK